MWDTPVSAMPLEPGTSELLVELRDGDRSVFDRLHAHPRDELRAIAHRRLEQFRPGEMPHTAALLHRGVTAAAP